MDRLLDVAVLGGARTPFVKAFGPMAEVSAQALGLTACRAALERSGVSPSDIDQVVLGNAATPADAPNIARVVGLKAGVPADRIGHTVHRNCASGMEAVTQAAQLIHVGEARTVLAGGVESMSRIPLLFSDEAMNQFLRVARARGWWQRLKALGGFRPRHFKPVAAIKIGLTDPVCGLNMGETAEVLAEEFKIPRDEQDRLALRSHQLAAQARNDFFPGEIVPVTNGAVTLQHDIGPRPDQSLEALAKLKPYFKSGGTVTVGNSCQITDGAAALVLMSGERARAEGRKPLGYLRGHAYAGCDPRRMGLGPVFATNRVLVQTGLSLKDLDVVELNEAFAAQVLANQRAFASDGFAQKELSRSHALGELPADKMNPHGGAIALGHPIGATGTRIILTLLRELERRGAHWGLAALCVGGGQGGAVIVERRE